MLIPETVTGLEAQDHALRNTEAPAAHRDAAFWSGEGHPR